MNQFHKQKQLADNGDSKAQTIIGTCYFNGDRVTKDWSQAGKYLSKAAKQGILDAQYKLGIMYQEGGPGWTQDYTKALDCFKICLANPEIQKNTEFYAHVLTSVGAFYTTGSGCKVDLNQAKEFFIKGVQQGSASACYHLGRVVQDLKESPMSEEIAFSYYQKGAEKGDGQSMFMICMEEVQVHPDLAFYWLKKAGDVYKHPMVLQQLETLKVVKKEFDKQEEQKPLYKCATCNKADVKLSVCSSVDCSKEHQKEHWKSHKLVCKPPLSSHLSTELNMNHPETKTKISQEEKEVKWICVNVDPSHLSSCTGKPVFLIFNKGSGQQFSFFGQNTKVAKADKPFLKRFFGEGVSQHGAEFIQGPFLSWEAVRVCPKCNTRCTQGHLSVEVMIRTSNTFMTHVAKKAVMHRSIPRIWHIDCAKSVLTAPANNYDITQLEYQSIEQAWLSAGKDVEEFQSSMLQARLEEGVF